MAGFQPTMCMPLGGADVAGRDAIVALVFERFEEGKDHRDREVLDLQHTGANAALSGDEQDESIWVT